ncbi:ABC transporter permease [Streptococcus uberis]|uniref:ABC transporter permease n=1 Tax=Streptococcus uberis TaxID=1349 RepID=UPI000E06C2AF|nr:ABC transporter permease [Streptococcus uberis]MCK1200858.1 ABC transporter permease [Streptococcus uberis]MCK1206160.1 ABC transporter permease [Streptococcus uberis]MCR4258049.1 ABC transporter permease [Streptococcus uberis]SUO89135.1 ribose transport system permease RbsC [Streptococcus uberis]
MASTSTKTEKKKLDFFEMVYKYGTFLTIILLVLFFSLSSQSFLTQDNIITIFRSISIVTIIAIGMTISLTVGGFDLSVGSVASVAVGIVISMFVWHQQNTFIAIMTALLIALILGMINAFMIVKVKIPDMLMTLATMFVYQGIALTYSKGAIISENMIMPNGDTAPGQIPDLFSQFGKVPWIILIMFIIVIIVHIFLNYTRHGRYMYIIGGNIEAARLSGINVDRYRMMAYVLSAFLAAVGGIVLASRVMTAEVNPGAPYLMDAVAACYIGQSVGGSGKANAIGTLFGAVLIGILQNGLVMLSVPYYAMDIVKGVVLAFALTLTYYRKK